MVPTTRNNEEALAQCELERELERTDILEDETQWLEGILPKEGPYKPLWQTQKAIFNFDEI